MLHGDLLDVGCGQKPYASIFEPYIASYTGLEHPDTIHGREHVDTWGEATAMPFPDESFDSVVSFSVLEHLEEPDVAIREMYRVLRSSGTVLLQVPFIWGIHEAPRDFFRFTPYGSITS